MIQRSNILMMASLNDKFVCLVNKEKTNKQQLQLTVGRFIGTHPIVIYINVPHINLISQNHPQAIQCCSQILEKLHSTNNLRFSEKV